MAQSTKPEITTQKVQTPDGPKEVETWHLGQGTTIHNSVGCQHFFVQVTAERVRCVKDSCGLQLFGHCEKGVLIKE